MLPRDINLIIEVEKFKRKLTTWLLSLPDKLQFMAMCVPITAAL